MKKQRWFQKAEILAEGGQFFLRIPSPGARLPVFALVNFVGYTACPAVVFVRDARNDRFACERKALYRLKQL